MEYQFTLDENMALFVVVEDKYMSIYFCNVDPRTEEAYGRGFKLILPQYAVKHQLAIKRKTNINNNTTVSPTKIAGKDDSTTKIAKEEFVDATKILKEEVAVAKKIIKEEGIDATKFAGEQSDACEDQKAVSVQTRFVNELFIDCFKDPDYNSMLDTSSLDAETK
uniref:Uncharacterized protein n=1 Tax=Romanomermis culicivorax TaxID=13658 RepID=A0A915IX37_ROMCU